MQSSISKWLYLTVLVLFLGTGGALAAGNPELARTFALPLGVLSALVLVRALFRLLRWLVLGS
jgi:hypothetical protein